MAFDSTAPAASSPPSSYSPFVSSNHLAQRERLQPVREAIRGHVNRNGWLAREVGGCRVIGHTFSHPGGTFQLSVATNTVVEE